MNMKSVQCAAVGFIALVTIAATPNPKPAEEHRTVTMVLDRLTSNIEHEFVAAADAMPEEKYSFAPTNGEFKGVRTFAEQVKHVAAVNYIFGAAILSEKVPVDVGDESGPASGKTKSEVMKYLKESFT